MSMKDDAKYSEHGPPRELTQTRILIKPNLREFQRNAPSKLGCLTECSI
jgi:hypothetical protein